MPRVSVTRVIAAPPSKVWAVISDVQNARKWNRAWSKIEITSNQTHGSGTTFRAHTEDGQTFDFLVGDWVAPEYIAFVPVRDPSERYGITLESHSFRLQPAPDDQTLAELTAHASAHGLRGRFVAIFFWPGHQKQGLEIALDSLEAAFGSVPASDAVPGSAESPPDS